MRAGDAGVFVAVATRGPCDVMGGAGCCRPWCVNSGAIDEQRVWSGRHDEVRPLVGGRLAPISTAARGIAGYARCLSTTFQRGEWCHGRGRGAEGSGPAGLILPRRRGIGRFLRPRGGPSKIRRHCLRLREPPFPWVWSAGILGGLLVGSILVLSNRIKSLDRLR